MITHHWQVIYLLGVLLLVGCKPAVKAENDVLKPGSQAASSQSPGASEKSTDIKPVEGKELAEILETVAYGEELEKLSQGSQNPIKFADTVLVVGRTQNSKVPEVGLKLLTQAFIANSGNSNYRMVTIEDLTGSAKESLAGSTLSGGVQAEASQQQLLQYALSQGIPGVLSVSIDNFNMRPAKSIAGLHLGNLRGSISLLSSLDAARIATTSATSSGRSTDEDQLLDKALNQLASALAAKTTDWKLPENPTENSALCEVHARIEGLTMPSFKEQKGFYAFAKETIPLYASGASVEIDGILMGQTPCQINTGRGLRKLKVYRDGMKPFEATVNLTGQSRYDAILSPTEETLSRFNQQLILLRQLQEKQELNRGAVNVLNGYAKMLRQSGLRVDYRQIDDSQKLSLDGEDK